MLKHTCNRRGNIITFPVVFLLLCRLFASCCLLQVFNHLDGLITCFLHCTQWFLPMAYMSLQDVPAVGRNHKWLVSKEAERGRILKIRSEDIAYYKYTLTYKVTLYWEGHFKAYGIHNTQSRKFQKGTKASHTHLVFSFDFRMYTQQGGWRNLPIIYCIHTATAPVVVWIPKQWLHFPIFSTWRLWFLINL